MRRERKGEIKNEERRKAGKEGESSPPAHHSAMVVCFSVDSYDWLFPDTHSR